MGVFFGVAKISNIYFGRLKFLIFLGGEGYMLGPSLRMKKKYEYTPHPLGDVAHHVSLGFL